MLLVSRVGKCELLQEGEETNIGASEEISWDVQVSHFAILSNSVACKLNSSRLVRKEEKRQREIDQK